MLKRVLSSEALKPTKDTKSQDFRRQHKDSVIDLAATYSKTNPEHDDRLLQQLMSEQDSKFLAQVEEVTYFDELCFDCSTTLASGLTWPFLGICCS